MTHEGRMIRGEANIKANILPENNDTIYFLENSKPEPVEPEEPKEEKPKKKKKGSE